MTCLICNEPKSNIESTTLKTNTHICTDCVDERVIESMGDNHGVNHRALSLARSAEKERKRC